MKGAEVCHLVVRAWGSNRETGNAVRPSITYRDQVLLGPTPRASGRSVCLPVCLPACQTGIKEGEGGEEMPCELGWVWWPGSGIQHVHERTGLLTIVA